MNKTYERYERRYLESKRINGKANARDEFRSISRDLERRIKTETNIEKIEYMQERIKAIYDVLEAHS